MKKYTTYFIGLFLITCGALFAQNPILMDDDDTYTPSNTISNFNALIPVCANSITTTFLDDNSQNGNFL